ncbi:hypothetical protein ABW19_dt0205465 [Dactylella cylindrospora]|nr:hypothetical protein ABW19_dt0205465 [Dactylella cylindrospora]
MESSHLIGQQQQPAVLKHRPPDIPQRDASIGGAASTPSSPIASTSYSPNTSPRRHRRQVSAPEQTEPSLRVNKGKGKERVIDPDDPDQPTSSGSPQTSAKARPLSPNTKQFSIEPRKSSLNASKPTFTIADDRGPLQKLELELKRIGKEEGLIGPEASTSTGVSRTLSRKQAQRLLRSTEVTSKQTAIAQPETPAEPAEPVAVAQAPPAPTHKRSASQPTPRQSSKGKGGDRYSAPFAERARQEKEQGTVRQPREQAGFEVMDTLPPPRSHNHSPVSNRSVNGHTPAASSHGEPSKIPPKVVDRHKQRFHLHHRHKEGGPVPVRENLYLDVGEAPQYNPHCAHLTRSDLELVEDEGEIADVPVSFDPAIKVKCGPLLRYTGLRQEGGVEIWRGSILIVTADAESTYEPAPTIRIFGLDGELPLDDPEDDIIAIPAVSSTGEAEQPRPASSLPSETDASQKEAPEGLVLPASLRYNYAPATSWPKSGCGRYRRDGERQGKTREITAESIHSEKGATFWRFNLEIELGGLQQRIGYRINNGAAVSFWVPARDQTMNIMFHSCNGFSLAVDPNNFCGPDPLWRDVLRNHIKKPFHVMLGGGDQIYNDCVQAQAPKFKAWLAIKDQKVKDNTPFDQEFQDELNSFYLERYCLWFSQGLFGVAAGQIPQANCFDDHDIIDGFGSYPEEFNGCPVFAGLGTIAFKFYLLFQHHTALSEGEKTEPSWVLGAQPGPFIKEPSRSTFMFLGRRVAFMALDCRTERTRDMLLTNDTYTRVFQRLEQEIVPGQTKHLIILLGVPIAYPRLVWLENILTSSLMDPIKYIASKRNDGTLNGFLNKFDGGVELLDDMMDHWTARGHKRERNWFILELQKLAANKDCRVTFLGGDVHLGTFGHFFSRARLKIPKINDHRYMVNVVSSAIVNTPPPTALADLLNKRNKIHKLQRDTHEEQIKIFFNDPKGKKRSNNTTLPARNYCRISENRTGQHVGQYEEISKPLECESETDIDFHGGLDLVINFEVDQHDPHGWTKPYGFTTPILQKTPAA